MKMVALKAAARSSDTSANQLRRTGVVPGVVYGNVENTSLQCEENALKKAYIQAGESTLVELEIGDKKLPVLFHSLDFDPVSDRLSHVDFYAVDMKKEVDASVPLRFEGESLAVKDLAAILVTPIDHVRVKALPANLPHELVVHLDSLTEFGSTITVSQLKVPDGVTVLEAGDTVVVVAQEPRAEEVEEVKAPAEGEAAAAAPGAEGEAGAGAPAAEGKADAGKKE